MQGVKRATYPLRAFHRAGATRIEWVALVALLASIALTVVPAWQRARATAHREAVLGLLHRVDRAVLEAMRRHALPHRDEVTDPMLVDVLETDPRQWRWPPGVLPETLQWTDDRPSVSLQWHGQTRRVDVATFPTGPDAPAGNVPALARPAQEGTRKE